MDTLNRGSAGPQKAASKAAMSDTQMLGCYLTAGLGRLDRRPQQVLQVLPHDTHSQAGHQGC